MERWDQFVEQSDNTLNLLLEGEDVATELASLKKDPNRAAKLFQQASKERDKEKLAQLARILMTDPEIKAAAQVISLIPAEVKKMGVEAPDLTEIDLLDKFSTAATGAADAILSAPKVKKILPLGGVTLWLGALGAALQDPQLAGILFAAGLAAFKCAGGDGAECLTSIVDTVATEAGGVEGTMTGQAGQE